MMIVATPMKPETLKPYPSIPMTTRSLFGAVKKSALSEDIVDRLLTLIRERELRPGDKLPPERELAMLMGVSRPSLREALRALSIMNVLEIRQGDGAYVTALEPEQLMAHLDFVFALTDATFLELFEARRVLEPGIVALAALRIGAKELEQLEACYARSVECVADRPAFAAADLELHELIAKAAGNQILERFIAGLSQLGQESRRRTVALPGIPEQSVRDHRAIIDALRRHDPAAAQQAMLEHLDNVLRELRQLH
jgi:GntR family transcriptional regulator, transcriptional repressor for pyruvate dehydrogenase complex